MTSKIGGSIFGGCTSLKNIKLSADNQHYVFEDGILYDSSKMILFFCTNRRDFVVPDTMMAIGEFAFGSCTSLVSITIPNSVPGINEFSFLGCTSLKKIRLSADNKFYMFEDGALYDLTLKSLLFSTNRRKFAVPDSVTKIGGSAFWGCTSLVSIIIPDSVTEIGLYAFYGCTSLKSIIAPRKTFEKYRYHFPRDVQLQEL